MPGIVLSSCDRLIKRADKWPSSLAGEGRPQTPNTINK